MTTKCILLRHGETDYPHNKYYCDLKEDPPLNRTGLKQAKGWGNFLNDLSLSAVYVSPSRRTRETAGTATRGGPLNPVAMKGLQERGFGTWEGLTSKKIKEDMPDEWQALKDDVLNFRPPGGESLVEFSARVNDTIQLLLLRHPGQTIMIVTHVGPIRMMVSAALGVPLENFKRLVVGYCSITEIEYTKSWPNLISFSRKPDGS